MPKGVYDHWKIRGVTKEENSNLTWTEERKLLNRRPLDERGHGPDCNCCVCEAKRGESEGVGKGKNYEEIYGPERAEEERTKRRHGHPARLDMLGENNPAKRPEVKAKLKAAGIENWADPEYRERQLKAVFEGMRYRPTKPEKQLDELFQKRFPNEWKYVGDGSFWMRIDGKFVNPDFVNINGQKKIIEFFGEYHHGEGVTGIPNKQHEQERRDIFAKRGYQTLIIWGYEFQSLDLLIEKILNFTCVDCGGCDAKHVS